MVRRAKLVLTAVTTSSIIGGIYAVTVEPSRFPFLNKYKIVGTRSDSRFVTLVLKVDGKALTEEALKSTGRRYIISSFGGGLYGCTLGADSSKFLLISAEGGPYQTAGQPGRCEVRFQRTASILDKGWTWCKGLVNPLYRLNSRYEAVFR